MLEGRVRRRSTPLAWALRCRIILACATGASNKDVAAQLGSTPKRWAAGGSGPSNTGSPGW
ncbi:hypothetical protein JCM18897A_59820 [Streptomyces sp. JCM 18897]